MAIRHPKFQVKTYILKINVFIFKNLRFKDKCFYLNKLSIFASESFLDFGFYMPQVGPKKTKQNYGCVDGAFKLAASFHVFCHSKLSQSSISGIRKDLM